ncbi:hypothetical protein GF352_02045 [archaeon]|nr:hypothetical protein [archaeon]
MKKEHLSTLSHLKKRVGLIKSKPGLLRTEDIDLVYKFASKLTSKDYLGGMVQAVVLFGSVMRKKRTKDSDLDVLVILDDISNELTSEMASAYSLTVGSLLAKLNAHDKIHLTTLGMIRFWDGVLNGEPVITSIIRSGKAIVDTGFFSPLKAMLAKGMIKPTREAVVSHLRMAESLVKNQQLYHRRAVTDFYWAVMDAAHAAVMHAGEETTHPKEVSALFKKIAPSVGLDPKLSSIINKFLDLSKQITRGRKLRFTGKQVDDYKEKADAFVQSVKKVIEK